MRKQEGFTLIELLIIIAIVGILIPFLPPKCSGTKQMHVDKMTEATLMSEVTVVDQSAWFVFLDGCEAGHDYAYEFEAKNLDGEPVSGVWCCGYWFDECRTYTFVD